MAKKFGKLLMLAAAIGAIAAGAYYFMHRNQNKWEDMDDLSDMDDFDSSSDEGGPTAERSYVSLNLDENPQSDEADCTDSSSSGIGTAAQAVEKVEEFFDDEEAGPESI